MYGRVNVPSPSHYFNLAVFFRAMISRKDINQQTPPCRKASPSHVQEDSSLVPRLVAYCL